MVIESDGSDAPLREAVRAYAELQPALRVVTSRFVALITELLDDAGINYLSVEGRTKSVASYAAKAAHDPTREITDEVGVRVITYVHSDVAAVAAVFDEHLRIDDDRDLGEETASEGRFGYASRHLLLSVVDPAPEEYDDLLDRRASVQVRTVLQHAWAEFEHDVRYKGTVPAEYALDLDRRFTLAAGLLELADQEFSAIRSRLQGAAPASAPTSDPVDPRISGQELAAFLAGQYADAGWSHTDHYGWIAGLLLEVGITSLDELAALLSSVDPDEVIRQMGYRHPAGAVRRLDDALLAIFGQRYVDLTGNSHRRPQLQTRLAKLTASDG